MHRCGMKQGDPESLPLIIHQRKRHLLYRRASQISQHMWASFVCSWSYSALWQLGKKKELTPSDSGRGWDLGGISSSTATHPSEFPEPQIGSLLANQASPEKRATLVQATLRNLCSEVPSSWASISHKEVKTVH